MIQLTKYINIPVFIISFAIGLFFVYATVGDMRTIYIYPSPENVELMLYRDKASQCFAFEQNYNNGMSIISSGYIYRCISSDY